MTTLFAPISARFASTSSISVRKLPETVSETMLDLKQRDIPDFESFHLTSRARIFVSVLEDVFQSRLTSQQVETLVSQFLHIPEEEQSKVYALARLHWEHQGEGLSKANLSRMQAQLPAQKKNRVEALLYQPKMHDADGTKAVLQAIEAAFDGELTQDGTIRMIMRVDELPVADRAKVYVYARTRQEQYPLPYRSCRGLTMVTLKRLASTLPDATRRAIDREFFQNQMILDR